MDLTRIFTIKAKGNELSNIIINIKNFHKGLRVEHIDSIEDLSGIIGDANNLRLFASPSSTKPKILILNNINLEKNHFLAILNLKNDSIKAIYLINCKLPKDLAQKIKTAPINLLQKKTIKYAQAQLKQFLTFDQIQQVLPSLLMENSDYYIDLQLLENLIKMLSIPQINKELVIKNFRTTDSNIFNLTKIFLTASLAKTSTYIETLLKTQDINSILTLLKNNLQLIYLLKITSKEDVAKSLHKNPYYLEQLKKAALNIDKQIIFRILILLFEFENNIRKGKYNDPKKQFLIFLIKIKGIIAKNTK